MKISPLAECDGCDGWSVNIYSPGAQIDILRLLNSTLWSQIVPMTENKEVLKISYSQMEVQHDWFLFRLRAWLKGENQRKYGLVEKGA